MMTTYHGHVLDDDDLNLVAVRLEECARVGSFGLRADGTTNGVALLQETLRDGHAREAVDTGEENLARSDSGHDGCLVVP